MIIIDNIEISYNGNNGWSYRREGDSISRPAAVNDRFGDGASIISPNNGNVIASPGKAAIAAEIAAWSVARDERASKIAASTTVRAPARSSVSQFEYANLRNSLGDSAARDFRRQMQG